MKSYSTNIIINASQESVWKILSDVTHWHEWTPTVNQVEVLNTPELKFGNRYKVIQPKLQPATWTVIELTTSNFTWESKSTGMDMVAEHILKPINQNQTELTLTFTFNGWLGNIISKIYGKLAESYIQTEAQSLKKKVENL